MTTARVHILYIAEFSTGGSVESLLCLVGGLNKSQFKASVLFYAMPDAGTCERFASAGASIFSLYPRSSDKTRPKSLPKLSMQARIRRLFGMRVERYYETLKYGLDFMRFRIPIYKAIRHQIREITPDLIHFNNGVGTDTPGILAARRSGVPAVCHIRTLGKITLLSVAASRSVRAFLCISHAVRDVATAQGVDAKRCIVVPNAVDLSRFNSAASESKRIRAEFGCNDSHQLIALVGRVVSWKGQDYFIRALARAFKNNRNIRGLIVGEGEDTDTNRAYIDGLHSLVSESGLANVVTLTGHRADVPEIMQAADAVVCASSEPEPFGRVIIESMATGTVVIATNAGGATDIIQDNVNGLLVPIKDSASLAGAIMRLQHESGLSERLRTAASADAQKLYTVPIHVEQVCDVYRSSADIT